MPETVIHELRNRFSRFRTRHEDWYVEKKEAAEEARTGRARQRVTMRTPLEEFNRQQRKMRRAIGQPVLTDEMLENIGRVIAKNKQRMLASAGMTEVSSGSKDVDLAALGATADKESRASPP
jgi:large subunit ribosomal protein L24